MPLPGLESYGSSSDEDTVGSGSGYDGAGAASPLSASGGAMAVDAHPLSGVGPFVGPAALEANGIAVGASGGADGAPATTGTAGAALVAGVAGEEPPPKMRRGRPLGKAPHSCGHKDCLMLTLDQEQQKRYTCPACEAQIVGESASKASPGPMTRLGAAGGLWRRDLGGAARPQPHRRRHSRSIPRHAKLLSGLAGTGRASLKPSPPAAARAVAAPTTRDATTRS